MRYLGLPLLTKRMSASDYQPLIERIKRRISNWSMRLLSFAGRWQLVTSVIASITQFWSSAFRLPRRCLNEIERLCSGFLWSGEELNARKAKVSWVDLCYPKREGGLGFRPLDDSNMIFGLRLMIWKILKNDSSLWVRWIKGYLIGDGSFWTASNKTGSWIWRKLLELRELASDFVRTYIKSGTHASFWFDRWSALGRLIDATCQRGARDLGIPLTASVSEAVGLVRGSRRQRSLALNQVISALHHVSGAGFTSGCDVISWKQRPDTFGPDFSSKLTWDIIRKKKTHVSWSKSIWFKYAVPKYAFLSWIAVKDRLPTANRMATWCRDIATNCIFCRAPLENKHHLFFSCSFSGQIWKSIAGGLLGSNYTSQWDSIFNVLQLVNQDWETNFLLRLAFQSSLYHIWREQNERRHGQTNSSTQKIVALVDKSIRDKLISIRTLGDHKYDTTLIKWFATRG